MADLSHLQATLLDSMPSAPHAPLQLPASASKPYEGAAADVFTCGVLLYRLLVGAQAAVLLSSEPACLWSCVCTVSDDTLLSPARTSCSESAETLVCPLFKSPR